MTEWQEALEFFQEYYNQYGDDFTVKLLWTRLQLGHRTNELLQTIEAIKALRDESEKELIASEDIPVVD